MTCYCCHGCCAIHRNGPSGRCHLIVGRCRVPPALLVVAKPGEAALKLDAKGLDRANMIQGTRAENV